MIDYWKHKVIGIGKKQPFAFRMFKSYIPCKTSTTPLFRQIVFIERAFPLWKFVKIDLISITIVIDYNNLNIITTGNRIQASLKIFKRISVRDYY